MTSTRNERCGKESEAANSRLEKMRTSKAKCRGGTRCDGMRAAAIVAVAGWMATGEAFQGMIDLNMLKPASEVNEPPLAPRVKYIKAKPNPAFKAVSRDQSAPRVADNCMTMGVCFADLCISGAIPERCFYKYVYANGRPKPMERFRATANKLKLVPNVDNDYEYAYGDQEYYAGLGYASSLGYGYHYDT